MSTKKRNTKKKPGLRNPIAVAAATAGAETAVKAAPQAVSTVNKETKGGLSYLLLIGLAAGIYTVWKLTAPMRSASGAISNIFDGVGNINEDDPITVQGTPTISDLLAQSKAQMLHDAMRGPGTDWKKIISALTGLTLADFTLVSEKFGLKTYAPNGSGWWGDQLNLLGWLQRELSAKEINELKTIIPGLF